MVMHLDRPFDLPAGTSPANLITQVFANNSPGIEFPDFRFPDGSVAYQNDGGGVSGSFHAGVDYGIHEATPLKAPATGVVIFAQWDTTGYGNRVDLRHGDIYTLYGHLEQIDCHFGQVLAPRQRLGLSGHTGHVFPADARGAHLHWGVYHLVQRVQHFLDPSPFVLAPAANNIHAVDFTVEPQDDGSPVRVFKGPSTGTTVLQSVDPANKLDCNAWTFGEPRTDHSTGHLDARWYRVAADGGWVASARVNGNAPGTNSLP